MKSRTITRRLATHPADAVIMPRTEAEYDALVERLRKLRRQTAVDDSTTRMVETIEALIEKYDDQHYVIPDASPVEVLRFLMEEHDLKQSDLPEIGSQGVVSEVLSGHRQLNMRQIQALAKRFGVQPAAFIPRLQRKSPTDADMST
jgi:HTH-type transcriptional regulator / antitoxin HigA